MSQKKKKREKFEDIIDRTTPRDAPLDSEDDDYLANDGLYEIIKAQVGEDLPPKIGRDRLLAAALKLNLINDAQFNASPPDYLPNDELRKRLDRVGYPNPKDLKRDDLLKACLTTGCITEAEAGAARKRKDISDKRKSVAYLDEFCRTCRLHTLLSCLTKKERDDILGKVSKASELLSMIAFQRSYLVWLHMHDLFEAPIKAEIKAKPDGSVSLALSVLERPDLTDPNATFFRHCFTVGVKGCTSRDDGVQATLERYNDLFLPLDVPHKMRNAVSHAAKLYKTNFVNHFVLVANVLARVKKLASLRLFGIEEQRTDDEKATVPREARLFKVMVGVETGTVPDEQDLAALVTDIRAMLGLPEKQVLTERWLRANIYSSIGFTLQVAKVFDGVKQQVKDLMEAAKAEGRKVKLRKGVAKGVKWVPTHEAKRMAIHLDPSDIVDALLGHKLADAELAADVVCSSFAKGIKKAFGGKVGSLHGCVFTGSITTDGERVSVHFKRARPPKETPPADEDGAPPPPAAAPKAPIELPRIILAVDPGRINMATVTVFVDGKPFFVQRGKHMRVLSFQLRNTQYYTEAGFRIATMLGRHRRNRMKSLVQLDEDLKDLGLRTANVEIVKRRLRKVNACAEEVWGFAFSKKAASSRFRRDGGRRRVMDRFFSGIRKRLLKCFSEEEVDKAVMVWGCAKISPSGRGNLTVPTSGLAAVAARYWRVVPGDEFRTSSACPAIDCHKDVHAVRMVGIKQLRVTRARGPGAARQAHDVRKGFILGLRHRRMLTRLHMGKELRRKKETEWTKVVIKWLFDGHGGEERKEKDEKKKARAKEVDVTYIHGLRFCQGCRKLYDRDILGSLNIGIIWVCKAKGIPVPAAFNRSAQRAAKPRRRAV